MKTYLFILLMIGCIFQSCTEATHEPISEYGDAPAPVLNPVAQSLPGGAQITYQLPQDKNFLYVKAQTQIRDGITREIKASFYNNSLVIDGFADTKEYTVYLYSVGRNSKESEGVPVRVKPGTPPVYTVLKSIKESVQETFGGIKFGINNPSEADMRIMVSTPNSLNDMVTANAFYTSVPADKFSVRGYDPTQRLFSFNVQDRWGNTATFDSIFSPWYEERLDKKKFVSFALPGDMNYITVAARNIEYAWDDIIIIDSKMFQTTPTAGKLLPHTFTIDLGVKARLSRVLVTSRLFYGSPYSAQKSYVYNAGALKEWRIFGSTNPNPDGSWDGWFSMKKTPFVSFKPSGLPLGEFSDADYQRQVNGEEFEFDSTEPVRYLRWSVDKVWGGESYSFFNLTEITLYGDIVD
jgi:hypothetical protein